ncbi:MAG: cytidine deaminase [Clostridiales bacterium]|nr:cytidine deaminase [Clostridiales bacterium]
MLANLATMANVARENAYVPYSNFRVGVALLTTEGKIYTGCNIENVSFGATCCAERVAIFKAISEGHKDFKAIFITSDEKDYIYPCGICLQVMVEMDIPVIYVTNGEGEIRMYKLEELITSPFKDF